MKKFAAYMAMALEIAVFLLMRIVGAVVRTVIRVGEVLLNLLRVVANAIKKVVGVVLIIPWMIMKSGLKGLQRFWDDGLAIVTFVIIGVLAVRSVNIDMKAIAQAKLERADYAKGLIATPTVSVREMKPMGDELIDEWFDEANVVRVDEKYFHLSQTEYTALKKIQLENRDSVWRIDYDKVEKIASGSDKVTAEKEVK